MVAREVKPDSRRRRLSTNRTEVSVARIMHLKLIDHHLIARMITSQLDMKKHSIWKLIVEDFGIGKVCAKMVWPKLLNDDQKVRCIQLCYIIERFSTEPEYFEESLLMMRHGFLFTIRKSRDKAISGNFWCHRVRRKKDLESQNSKSIWGVSSSVTSCQRARWLVYKEILSFKLHSVREKGRDLWQYKPGLLHHDNASAQKGIQ